MARFVALLRGVNVGPTTRVPMAELRELLSELGASDVTTLLNSGNALFELHHSPKTIDDVLTDAISQRFGFQVDVVTRTKGQLQSVLAHDPLGSMVTDDSKYIVAFMPARPSAAKLRAVLEAEYPGGERCAAKGREFYVWSPNGVSESRSLPALLKSGAVPFATARNVRTLRKIVDLL